MPRNRVLYQKTSNPVNLVWDTYGNQLFSFASVYIFNDFRIKSGGQNPPTRETAVNVKTKHIQSAFAA